MEEMKKARVIYQKDNGHGKEGYAVETFIEGEWGLECFYPLVRRENANDDEEKNFVHYGIINKIFTLKALGYEFLSF